MRSETSGTPDMTQDPWSNCGNEKKHCSRSRPCYQKLTGTVWGVWPQTEEHDDPSPSSGR